MNEVSISQWFYFFTCTGKEHLVTSSLIYKKSYTCWIIFLSLNKQCQSTLRVLKALTTAREVTHWAPQPILIHCPTNEGKSNVTQCWLSDSQYTASTMAQSESIQRHFTFRIKLHCQFLCQRVLCYCSAKQMYYATSRQKLRTGAIAHM